MHSKNLHRSKARLHQAVFASSSLGLWRGGKMTDEEESEMEDVAEKESEVEVMDDEENVGVMEEVMEGED